MAMAKRSGAKKSAAKRRPAKRTAARKKPGGTLEREHATDPFEPGPPRR